MGGIMRLIHRGLVLSLVASLALVVMAPVLPVRAAISGDLTWQFAGYEKDKAVVILRPDRQTAGRQIAVADVPARELLAKAREGDIVKFTADDIVNPAQLAKLIEVSRPVSEAACCGETSNWPRRQDPAAPPRFAEKSYG